MSASRSVQILPGRTTMKPVTDPRLRNLALADPPDGCGRGSAVAPRGAAADPARAAVGTVPSRSGAPNAFGLYNLCGNVWEWAADRIGQGPSRRVLKGGSFLCHESHCFSYRIAARIGASPVSTSHQGFRVLLDGEAA